MSARNHKKIEIEWFVSNIEKHGLAVIMVESTDYLPSFAYSVGLWQKYNHPEIICFGLTTKLLHKIINDVAEIIKTGTKLESHNTYLNIFKESRAEFLNVDKRNIGDYFVYAIEYYKTKEFPALQLVWTDLMDRFPWEKNFEKEFKYKQPLLDRNVDFKFRESKNLGIFTTRQWLELNEPILQVIHESTGEWQFLTGDQHPEDIKLVCLEEMTKRDKTLNDLFNLDYGECAERDYIGGHNTITRLEEEEE